MGEKRDIVSPYQGLGSRAFWRSGVAEAASYPPAGIYRPKFPIARDAPIFTAGSCFAQHVGRVLRENGFAVLDGETVPGAVPDNLARRYGYRMYSARYGNIYTVRQLHQLLAEAFGEFRPADPVWERDGAFFDALRPGVEPDGLASPDLVAEARTHHLDAIRDTLAKAQVLVFTLGLTEAWEHAASGTVYPTAPGTIAGRYDPGRHRFRNFRATEIRDDFLAVRDRLRAINPDMRFLLTVSPVPLTATAGDQHVLPATVYSKSVLRTVAGELAADFDDIDYFPSYEIVSSHAAPRDFYESNLRSVSAAGVGRVMNCFLAAHSGRADEQPSREQLRTMRELRRARRERIRAEAAGDVICEEELLDAFDK
ncbi:MAG: GSCFA domain-containing protein [Jhaorihella sp.]